MPLTAEKFQAGKDGYGVRIQDEAGHQLPVIWSAKDFGRGKFRHKYAALVQDLVVNAVDIWNEVACQSENTNAGPVDTEQSGLN